MGKLTRRPGTPPMVVLHMVDRCTEAGARGSDARWGVGGDVEFCASSTPPGDEPRARSGVGGTSRAAPSRARTAHKKGASSHFNVGSCSQRLAFAGEYAKNLPLFSQSCSPSGLPTVDASHSRALLLINRQSTFTEIPSPQAPADGALMQKRRSTLTADRHCQERAHCEKVDTNYFYCSVQLRLRWACPQRTILVMRSTSRSWLPQCQ